MKRAIFDAKTRLLMRADRRAYREMIATERLDPDAVAALAGERSAAVALHAFRTSPFYREHYTAAGFAETDVAQPENFVQLPVLTKAHVQDAGDALVSSTSRPADRLPSRTGGSTGRPLQVYNDRAAPTAALWWRIYSWWGIHPSDDAAFIYRQHRAGLKKLRYDAEWWPTRHVLLDARGATAESVAEFDAVVRRVRPRLLVGYVEGVVDYAQHAKATGAAPTDLHAISVTASMLHAGQRELIEGALGAPVYDTYRSAEIPWIAAQCSERDGLHVLSDRRRVDLLTPDGRLVADGEVGDVAVTDLDNRVYPLIRYMIGDRAARISAPCACGRGLARITPIEGRIADALRTPSGRVVSGGLSVLFNDWPGIVQQFQIHQASDHAVRLSYVPGDDPGAAARAAGEAGRTLGGILNDEVPVEVVAVDAIESTGGKARLVVSDVAG